MRFPDMANNQARGYALMAVDPGGRSGVAWGWFNDEADSVRSAMARARRRGSWGARELAGPSWLQALVIHKTWTEFFYKSHIEMRVPEDRIELIWEDFQLRELHADLSPVAITEAYRALASQRIEWELKDAGARRSKKTDEDMAKKVACVRENGLVRARGMVLQQPSDMALYSGRRLEKVAGWVVGSEHMRDANRHLCVRLNRLLD